MNDETLTTVTIAGPDAYERGRLAETLAVDFGRRGFCVLVNPTEGRVLADGHDIVADYRAARSKIGLVPQELTTDAFETERV